MYKNKEIKKKLFSDELGRPNNCMNVHIIDGSTLNYLPAKNFSQALIINSMRIANKIKNFP